MSLLTIFTIYALGGVAINIWAEFIMEGDNRWTLDNRLQLFIAWPLALYAFTL
tara:strand:- start:1146 stop:1304 length:159 start_codon:yes stop_codon:yes gene_type:complete